MADFTIEKGIPIPSASFGTPKYRQLGIGDSVLIPCEKGSIEGRRAMAVAGSLNQRLKPSRFVSRTVEGGVRIWRVE
jgi:hypothetical protein